MSVDPYRLQSPQGFNESEVSPLASPQDEPETYLPNIAEFDRPATNPYPVYANQAPVVDPLTGVPKLMSQFARGATLGFLGDKEAPSGVGQHLAEFAGMVLPAVATRGMAIPLIARAPILKGLPPIAQRVLGAGAADAASGAAHAVNTGGDPLTQGVIGGVLGVASEAGWIAWARRAKGHSAPEQVVSEIKTHAQGLPPETPPLGAGPAAKATGQVGEQLELQSAAGRLDDGSLQLTLPGTLIPSTRNSLYQTPTRYKGRYETAELAAIEANKAAEAAIREGVHQVRVTTALGPRDGPTTGGIIRTYESIDGKAQLTREVVLNRGAVTAASAGASPMRRALPDYFDTKYSPTLQSDILTPKNEIVETALTLTGNLDPRQMVFPMSPEQLTWLNQPAGRAIRDKMDLAAKKLTFEDVRKMTEAEAKKALIDTDVAPPARAAAVVTPTDDAMRAQATQASLSISDNDVHFFLKSVEGLPPAAQKHAMMQWLQEKCF